MRTLILLFFLLFLIPVQTGHTQVRPTRPLHTFSIVCRDPATGELGVAVQSHWFSVGSIVPWAEAGPDYDGARAARPQLTAASVL